MKKFLSILLKSSKSTKVKIAVFTTVSLIAFFGYKSFIAKSKAPEYQTAVVERGTIVSSVSGSGQIISANMVTVETAATGVIKQIFVKDGNTVGKGDKIAEIELDNTGQQRNASYWSSYLSAKNALQSAKNSSYTLQSTMFSKWKTYKDLADSSSYDSPEERTLAQFHVAEKDWLAAEATYKNQENVITQSQAAMNSAFLSYQQSSPIIYSPGTGIVENITITKGLILSGNQSTSNEGNQSSSGQTIAIIKNSQNPLTTFNFSEVDVVKIKIGQKATITLDALSDKTFTGKVVSIDRIGQIISNVTNYPVIIELDTNSNEILPNMSSSANIIVETKDNILFVPSSAIQSSNGQTSVRIMKGSQIQEVFVETGISSDTSIEVKSGLSEGDKIITGDITGTTSSPFSSGFGPGFGSMRSGNMGARR